jgi:hypothetical protein
MPWCSIFKSAALATDPPSQVSRVGQAMSLFMLVGAVLGILIIGVLLVTLARHIRRGKRPEESNEPQTDPWREAGRRAQPFDAESPEP